MQLCCFFLDLPCVTYGWFFHNNFAYVLQPDWFMETSWQGCQDACVQNPSCTTYIWRNADHPNRPNECQLSSRIPDGYTIEADDFHRSCIEQECTDQCTRTLFETEGCPLCWLMCALYVLYPYSNNNVGNALEQDLVIETA